MSSFQDRFFTVLTDTMGLDSADLSADATFEALDMDSLALIELSVAVQKEFGIVVDETALTPEHTLGHVLGLLEAGAETDAKVAG